MNLIFQQRMSYIVKRAQGLDPKVPNSRLGFCHFLALCLDDQPSQTSISFILFFFQTSISFSVNGGNCTFPEVNVKFK